MCKYVKPGIHVNGKERSFALLMALGAKTIETRNKRTLDDYIGYRVYLIETGKRYTYVIGSVIITGVKEYRTRGEFTRDRFEHLTLGTSYWWKDTTKVKYGYTLAEPELYAHPIMIPAESYTGDRTARDLYGFLF